MGFVRREEKREGESGPYIGLGLTVTESLTL